MSSDEGHTTDGEVESDKEDSGGGAWWGRLDQNKNETAAVEVGVEGAISTAEESEGARKRRNGNKMGSKSRRSASSSPMKLRVSVSKAKFTHDQSIRGGFDKFFMIVPRFHHIHRWNNTLLFCLNGGVSPMRDVYGTAQQYFPAQKIDHDTTRR